MPHRYYILFFVIFLSVSACQHLPESVQNASLKNSKKILNNKVTLLEKPGSQALLAAESYRESDPEAAKSALIEASQEQSATSVRAKAFREYAKIQREEEGEMSKSSIELLQTSHALGDEQAARILAKHYADRGEFTKAIELLRPLADTNVQAKASLGKIYEYLRKGSGEAMIDEAIGDYNAMLKAKDPSAHLPLATIHYDQDLPFYNSKYALHHFEQAAKHGYEGAYSPLATIYHEGRITPRDTEKAVYYYDKLAQGGNERAIRKLAEAYDKDGWHRFDAKRSVAYYTILAEKDNSKAIRRLVSAYKKGGWYKHNPKQAYRWLQRSVEQAAPNKSQFRHYLALGEFNIRGYGIKQNTKKAKYYYDKAIAERPDQTYKVSKMLFALNNDAANKLAYKYLQKARSSGDASANKYFASTYMRNMNTLAEVNNMAAFIKSGQKAADNKLYYKLANKYFSFGETEKGLEWMKKAADAGYADAMKYYAKRYAVGQGVTQSFAASFSWYEKAARIGDSEAQYHTGLAYARGLGVEKNKEKAIDWLSKASKNGQKAAEAVLKSLNKEDNN